MTKYVTAKKWLEAWDNGEDVPSVSMGGMSEGYENAIQTTAAEIIRWLLDNNSDYAKWEDADVWKRTRDAISDFVTSRPPVEDIGLSFAQWGAAMNLATIFYRRGPDAAMDSEAAGNEEIKDRLITVRRNAA